MSRRVSAVIDKTYEETTKKSDQIDDTVVKKAYEDTTQKIDCIEDSKLVTNEEDDSTEKANIHSDL